MSVSRDHGWTIGKDNRTWRHPPLRSLNELARGTGTHDYMETELFKAVHEPFCCALRMEAIEIIRAGFHVIYAAA